MGKSTRTLSYLVQWLLIIAVVAVCARVFFRPVPTPDRRPETWRSWDGFYALSYGSIRHGATGTEVSSELLREHLAALSKAGYKTVTPDDLARYVDGGHALPEKPLLLMFEGGRKDSVLNITPLLREFGFVGVACISTGASESRDRFYLRSPELKDLARQPHWQLGSMGHQAMSHLSDDPQTSVDRHFLTDRKVENGLTEEDTAFVLRVMQDYSTSANFLYNLTGRTPVLFLYPYADRGLGAGADALAGRVNRMAVELTYRLAFVEASEPFNGPTRDRYDLTRLRVDGRMTAPALLDRLTRSKLRPRVPDSPVSLSDCTFSPKTSQPPPGHAGEAGPQAIPIATGAVAWIKGSEDWTDSEISGKVKFGPDSVAGIYSRYAGPERCLYLSVSASGIRVQERNKSGNHVTLLDYKTALQPDREYPVRLRIKRNRALVFLEGRQLGESIPLSSVQERGRTGIGSNGGSSTFSAVSAGPLPNVFVLGSRYRTLPAALRESAMAFLTELPVGEAPDQSGGSVCVDEQQAREMVAAAAEGVEPIPLVDTLARPTPSVLQTCTKLSEVVTLQPLVSRLALRGIGAYKPQELSRRTLAPVRVLQASQVRNWLTSSKDTKQETILVEGAEPDVVRAIHLLLHNIPPHRLIASVDRLDRLPPGVGRAVHPRSPEQP